MQRCYSVNIQSIAGLQIAVDLFDSTIIHSEIIHFPERKVWSGDEIRSHTLT